MIVYERFEKCSGQFLVIRPPIQNWNQDTNQETWKDLN